MAGVATLGVVLLAGVVLCASSGCSSAGYLAQSVEGHLAILNAARPVADWESDPAAPPKLRARLALSQQMRDFAVS